MWIGVPVWPFLLAGAVLVAIRWNPHIGIALALHILAMQGVKILRPEWMDASVAFFAVYTASAVLTAMFADRVTGGLLALMALVLLAHKAGLLPFAAQLVATEALFVLALFVGAIGGPASPLLAGGAGRPRPADAGAGLAPVRAPPAPLLAADQGARPPPADRKTLT